MSEYKERDIEELGEFYFTHISAMTGESLHSKSDIAAELAHRDMIIDELSHGLRISLDSFETLIDDIHKKHPNADPTYLKEHIKKYRLLVKE